MHVATAAFADAKPGRHTIKIWRLDDNAILQKLVLACSPERTVH
jgi:hypothetical protein